MMPNHVETLAMMLAADREIDLEPKQLYLLSLLCEQGGLRVLRAAVLINLSVSQTSRQLNDLVRRGYATRHTDDVDMRVITFLPTDKGRALDARVQEHLAAIQQKRPAAEPA